MTDFEKAELISSIKERGNEFRIFPLSAEQSRMWYLYQLEPDNPYYNLRFMIKFTGKVQVNRIREILLTLIGRHKMLGTKVLSVDGEIFQYFNDIKELDIPIYSVHDINEIWDYAARKFDYAFDLENEIPIRFCILRYGEEETYLLGAAHHMFIDGHSIGVLFDEFCTFYPAGSISYLSDVIQYPEYIKEQNMHDHKKDTLFWQSQLDSADMLLRLPLEKQRETGMKSGLTISRTLPESDFVRDFCKQERISAYSFFMGIYYLALRNMCGQEDIVIGTPILNREKEDYLSVVGCFANTIPIRIQTEAENITIKEFYSYVNNQVLACIEHGSIQFNELVDLYREKHIDGMNPIYQTMFLFGEDEKELSLGKGVNTSLINIPNSKNVILDLLCAAIEKNGRYIIEITFRENLLSKGNMNHLLDLIDEIYEGIAADAGRNAAAYGADMKYSFMGQEVLENQDQKETYIENLGTESAQRIADDIEQIWRKLLGKRNFLRTDKFFVIGGDSLKCIKMVSLINSLYDCNLKVADIFKNPTVNRIAGLIDKRQSCSMGTVFIEI